LIDKTHLIKNINLENKIYIAFSGGADSSALLHMFAHLRKEYSIQIEAIHVNHNLSKDSKGWEDHCKSMCKSIDINLIIKSIHISVEGDGLESAARKARYGIFSNLLKEGEQILLAHHSNDVAETFFLRLFRGTGMDGLEGPPVRRAVGSGFLIRPLLDYSKKDLLSYIDKNNISFIEDTSNFEINQDRNFIRNSLIPKIEERWINASDRISNTSKLIESRNILYKELFKKEYDYLVGKEIPVKDLKNLDNAVCIEIIRSSIAMQNIAMPNKKITEEIFKTFILSRPGPKSEVQWSRADNDQQGGKVIYKNGCIVITNR